MLLLLLLLITTIDLMPAQAAKVAAALPVKAAFLKYALLISIHRPGTPCLSAFIHALFVQCP